MLNRRTLLTGAAATGGAAALLSGVNGARAQADGAPIPVGSALPISGLAAADGIEFRNGLIEFLPKFRDLLIELGNRTLADQPDARFRVR